jgi:hypothetical protein
LELLPKAFFPTFPIDERASGEGRGKEGRERSGEKRVRAKEERTREGNVTQMFDHPKN